MSSPSEPDTFFEHVKQHKWLIAVGGLVVIFLAVSLSGGYVGAWGWVGVTARTIPTPTDTTYLPSRTLWDWLQLLIIPMVLAGIGLWFTSQQRQRDAAAATDTQREEALAKYFERMSDLLLEDKHKLSASPNSGTSKQEPDPAAISVAHALTLAALRQLDANRNSLVLLFLRDAGLLKPTYSPTTSDKSRFIQYLHSSIRLDESRLLKPEYCSIISLAQADLSQADLRQIDLSQADLRQIDLSQANLYSAHLAGADLRGANLHGADLRHANLSGAHLRWADLSMTKLAGADLRGADLTRTIMGAAHLRESDLREADLRGAHLRKAILYSAQLGGADLRGADLYGADLREANLSEGFVKDFLLRWIDQSETHMKEEFERQVDQSVDLMNEELANEKPLVEELLSLAAQPSRKLAGADLRGAVLTEADLREADLRGAKYNKREEDGLPATQWPHGVQPGKRGAEAVD